MEERILEKELLYEQVGRLTDWVQKQVDANKTETLQLAKKVSTILTYYELAKMYYTGEQLPSSDQRYHQEDQGTGITVIHESGDQHTVVLYIHHIVADCRPSPLKWTNKLKH